jgi:hypothetical protein
MVVEHSFITTLEEPAAMAIAAAALGELGFQEEPTGGAAGAGGYSQEFLLRGIKGGRTAAAWPQRLIIDFDRGRVTLATSATPPARRPFQLGRRGTAQLPLVEQRLLLTVRSVEAILAGEPMESVRAQWETLRGNWRMADARARRRRRVVLVIVLCFFALAMAALVFAVVSVMH